LGEEFSDVGMHVHPFLLKSGRISNDARLISKETNTVSGCGDIVP
jgi:hypothetical protein